MEISTAVSLLKSGNYTSPATTSRWADLGCGNGLFTRALASLQKPGSTIYAIDADELALKNVTNYQSVTIETQCYDFVSHDWAFYDLDGILMANSLHYVPDKPAFIHKASQHLTESGIFLIVEYDTESANVWVPYPIGFQSLTKLFYKAGFTTIEKLGERPSLYGRATLYSASVSK